jgi:hypothetical protein
MNIAHIPSFSFDWGQIGGKTGNICPMWVTFGLYGSGVITDDVNSSCHSFPQQFQSIINRRQAGSGSSKRESDNLKKLVEEIVFEGECFDIMSVRR